MHSKIFAAAVLASAPLALAQSGVTSKPSATPSASSAQVITMMWESGTSNSAVASGSSMGASMTMSNGQVMSGTSRMSMSTVTGTAAANRNMTGSAGRTEMSPGAMGVGWVIISVGAGVGFLAGML